MTPHERKESLSNPIVLQNLSNKQDFFERRGSRVPSTKKWNPYLKRWMTDAEYSRAVELSKKVAHLLAECRATVAESKYILDLARDLVSDSTIGVL